MVRIKIDNEWAKCGECGHKLFKITGKVNGIEIKCHSCKAINSDILSDNFEKEMQKKI